MNGRGVTVAGCRSASPTLDARCPALRNPDARSRAPQDAQTRATTTALVTAPTLPLAGMQPHRRARALARRRRKRQTDEPAGHASVTAVQNADDDLLSDIATLGQADRAILDAGFERNRVVVHVDAESRRPRFDPAGRLRSHRHRAHASRRRASRGSPGRLPDGRRRRRWPARRSRRSRPTTRRHQRCCGARACE